MHESLDAASFSDDERCALAAALDAIIPPSRDGRLPGAGALGVAGAVEQAVASTPALRPVIAGGLAALDELAGRHGAPSFAALPEGERPAVLRELGSADPGFLGALVFQTYTAYYREPRVLEALGLEARPPFPAGHELPPFDPALLAGVRRRARMWRDA